MPAWSPRIPAVSPEGFDRVFAEQPLVLVHFWADWNGLDRQMDTWLQEFRPQFAERVAFRSFDTGPEEAWAVCRRYGISNLPTLVCFVGGEYHATRIGLGSRSDVEGQIRAWASEKIE